MELNKIIALFSLLSNKYIIGIIATEVSRDANKEKTIEVSAECPECEIYKNQEENKEVMSNTKPGLKFRSKFLNKSMEHHITTQPTETNLSFIYPGTKWCGPGSTAKDYDDLGTFTEEDKCCREHDQCPQMLQKGECLKYICNDSPFSRSRCDCDETFHKCLKAIDSFTANIIGKIYFVVTPMKCFREVCDSTRCWEEFQTLPTY